MSVTAAEISVVRNPAPAGAEIIGVDLSQRLDDETFEKIQEVINERCVVVFRDQHLTPDDQIQFAKSFGEVEKHILNKQYGLRGYPELLLIGNVKENGEYIGVHDGGLQWHTDLSYKANPTSYSFLYAVEVPYANGKALGDTLFVNTAYAYDTLSDNIKRRIEGLKAVHRYGDQFNKRLEKIKEAGGARAGLDAEQLASVPDVVHPIVRTHPITGRKCLFVNEWFTVSIVGLPEEEGRELLHQLCTHCTKPELIYRHKWQTGDLLIWDNPASQHQATFDFGPTQRRLMRRVVVKGSVPY